MQHITYKSTLRKVHESAIQAEESQLIFNEISSTHVGYIHTCACIHTRKHAHTQCSVELDSFLASEKLVWLFWPKGFHHVLF